MLTPEQIQEYRSKYGLGPAKTTQPQSNLTGNELLGSLKNSAKQYSQGIQGGGFMAEQATGVSPYQTGSFESSPLVPYSGKEGLLTGALKTAANVPTSAVRLIEAAVNPKTYIGLGQTIAGGIQSIPGIKEWYDKHSSGRGAEILEGNREAFSQFVEQIGNQYGSYENIKRSVVEDPVGTALLLRGLLEGGAKMTTGKTSAALKTGAETVFPIEKAIDGVSTLKTNIGKMKIGEQLTPEQITSKITQAKPKDIGKVTTGLMELPKEEIIKKGTTFRDVSNKLQEAIDINEGKTSKIFEGQKTIYPKKDAIITETTKSGKKIKSNYVDAAFEKFKDLYESTNESPINKVELQDMIDTVNKNGITAEGVDLLAKKFGTEFKTKAFGKTGEPLTSTTSQEFENIRTGLKETARKLINNEEVRKIDKQTSRFIRAKDYIDKMDEKLQKYVSNHEKPGLLKKAGSLAGKLLNVKRFLRGLLGIGEDGVTKLGPVELEKRLPTLLKQLEDINKMTPEDILKKYGE
jgi:hypothetical protein